jgi:hypothetical protein
MPYKIAIAANNMHNARIKPPLIIPALYKGINATTDERRKNAKPNTNAKIA